VARCTFEAILECVRIAVCRRAACWVELERLGRAYLGCRVGRRVPEATPIAVGLPFYKHALVYRWSFLSLKMVLAMRFCSFRAVRVVYAFGVTFTPTTILSTHRIVGGSS